MKYRTFSDASVKAAYHAYPKNIREKLLSIREMVFDVAEAHAEIGEIEETLKWEVPSYLTHSPKSGTTLRLSGLSESNDEYALSVHCQSNVISEFKAVYPKLNYSANRSIILNAKQAVPTKTVRHFIYAALSYHYRNKRNIGV